MPKSVAEPLLAQTLGFIDNPLERHSDKRDDAAAIAAWLNDARATTLVLAGDLPVLIRNPEAGSLSKARFGLAEAGSLGDVRNRFFLGTDDQGPVFATQVAAELAEPLKARGFGVADMRSIAVNRFVPTSETAALGMAKALLAWHETHQFCAKCGQPSVVAAAGWRRDCPACQAQHFPRTDPVVIMLVHKGDRCLLGRSPRFPTPMYSTLAGFMEPGETIEDAVRRETVEEVGIACGPVEYCFSQPWPFPMSLMIGCLAEASTENIVIDHNELLDAQWFSRDTILTMLEGGHPEGFQCPTAMSIAHHLIRRWLADTAS